MKDRQTVGSEQFRNNQRHYLIEASKGRIVTVTIAGKAVAEVGPVTVDPVVDDGETTGPATQSEVSDG